MKKALVVAAVLVLACGVALAQKNQDRGIGAKTTTLTTIGTCQPESDASAAGWDQNPTSGGWGGKDESLFAVVWEPGTPDVAKNAGRFAECTIVGVTGVTPSQLEINVLQGLANDDYCVFASGAAGDLLIGCVDETSSTENWVTDVFQLPAGGFGSGQDVTVKILVTGNSWPSFNTWGQLGVDWIMVKGQ